MAMRVLVADAVSKDAIDAIQAAGLHVVFNPQLTGDTLREAVQTENPQILVVRSTKVTADIIGVAQSLELIVRAGAGTDNIDSNAASARGIFVANCPGKNSHAVAELVMALLLSIDRRIADGVSLLKAGQWRKASFATCRGLKGRTLGIIGLGNIGRLVAARARSFELNVIGTDPFVTAQQAEAMGVVYYPTIQEVTTRSDFITFHVPALESTRGMINREFLLNCKPDVVLLNTSRGEIVNEEELLAALNENENLYYGCDVYQGEPTVGSADFVHPLAQHPRVYGTHHIGASTKQSEAAIGEEALRVILQYGRTGKLDRPNCVNLELRPNACCTLSIRHSGKGGVLAYALQTLNEAGYIPLEIENTPLQGAASFTSSVSYACNSCEPCNALVANLNANPEVINASKTCTGSCC